MGTMKLCIKCKVEKDLSEFNTKNDTRDKHSCYCRSCANEISKSWQKSHRDYFNAYKREQVKRPQYKIAHRYRVALRKFIHGHIPGYKLIVLTGAGSAEKLREYLISTIPEGYTILDYGKILCVDHIISCSHFDLTNDEELKACFNYKNLRLVTIAYNNKKYNKIEIMRDKFIKK